ncbi:unnamed protein product [Thlaspi arvense]|uniref:Uncharacterized protein n=1 Tax=Thlaspi arvense TaxID=13288 RepID=A0AAU9SI58_THLAR|nr:unnamed protein product [Thlaspi arvense]
MFAPPVAAASSVKIPPCPAVVEQSKEKALFSESTLSQLSFPNEFPYEFESSTFPSAFTAPEDSTGTEDETTDDEDDFLAGLTRRLALSTQRFPSPPSFVTDKAEVKPANSTESGLSGPGSCTFFGNISPNGPFSQAPSPPTFTFRKEDSLRVISAAAGEVAKIKMANFDAKPKPISRPDPSPKSSSVAAAFPQNAAFYDYYWKPQNHHYHPALNSSPYPVRGAFAAPNADKKPSAGTGVFLPRKFPDTSDSQKKAGGRCARVPTKVKAPKTEKPSGRCQPQSKARLSTGGNKIVSGGCVKEERHHLPQEWKY